MIKVGLVGLGGMGTVHWNNYKYIEDCRVVAAVGNSENDIRNAKSWDIPLFSDVNEMLDQTEVDVVDICTPTFLHYEHAKKSLSRGIHTFIEKPIALHKIQAEELYQLAQEKGAILLVGQAVRFSKQNALLKELVRTEKYGKVLDAYFERLSAAPRWAVGGWMFDKSKSGLLVFDLHIHDLDLIVSIFGKPLSYSYTSAGNKNKAYKEQYRFTYKYGDFNISAEAAWFNASIPFMARWRVYFENAVVINDGVTVTAYQFDHDPYVFDTEEVNKIPTGINVPPTEMYLNELNHFISCIRENKKSDIIKKEEIFNVLEILEDVSFHSENE
ncbi:Gfo/Idh/MocA family protein [Caproiciproducens galactitolivorans]|uniref:Gfo/Idh/MocA family oxidoreductase n=1 Tax=Caproiciproducens galactitolivorans TaxID=642589 RepID=A0ABT4BT58_9FIRM|nr:Gfo/Idh/MocA family oxidoreductase [Caproiciproducens galactitolivorans]MCY1713126.1 Gfo/Idh/MocA family oxidoreductase [Caproiciproducens galactitolivorans]